MKFPTSHAYAVGFAIALSLSSASMAGAQQDTTSVGAKRTVSATHKRAHRSAKTRATSNTRIPVRKETTSGGEVVVTQTPANALSIIVASGESASSNASSAFINVLSTPSTGVVSLPTPNASISPTISTKAVSNVTPAPDSSLAGAEPPDPDTPTNSISIGAAALGGSSMPLDTPEPRTDLLIGGGLIAAGVFARAKRKKGL